MNELQIFENAQFGQVRIIDDNGKPLFCGSDVAKALGYTRPNDAISAHCRSTVKHRIPHPQSPDDKVIEMAFIPEGDVYRLITHSKLPSAERFESWVFDEVLPAIRKTGGYIASAPEETPDEIMARALVVAQETLNRHKAKLEAAQAKIEADAPKVLFAETVSKAEGNILVREMAKILKQHGYDTGEHRLYETLKKDGFIIKMGADRNMPTQKSMNMGLMRITERTIGSGDQTFMRRTATITGKGQIYFLQRYATKGEQNEKAE